MHSHCLEAEVICAFKVDRVFKIGNVFCQLQEEIVSLAGGNVAFHQTTS